LGIRVYIKINNDNDVRVVNLPHQKIILIRVQCSHIATIINALGLLLMGKHNQIDHILMEDRKHSNIVNVQFFRAAESDTIFLWLRRLDRDYQWVNQ